MGKHDRTRTVLAHCEAAILRKPSLTYYEPEHLMVSNHIDPAVMWSAQELYGSAAEAFIAQARQAIILLCANCSWEPDGWVLQASGSLMASVNDGEVIIKAPLIDPIAAIEAATIYDHVQAGPEILATVDGSNVVGAMAMQRLDGTFFHSSDTPTLDELAEAIHLASLLALGQPTTDYDSLGDRLDVEFTKAVRRATQVGDTTTTMELAQRAQMIRDTPALHTPRHGNLHLSNVLHHNGDMRLINPRPVCAPAEFDAATIAVSTGYDPYEMAQHMRLDPDLTYQVYRFITLCNGLYQRVKTLS